MQLIDPEQSNRFKALLDRSSPVDRIFYDKLLPLTLFGFLGAFAWALRGTGGFGGTSGGAVAGFWWGFLYFYLARMRGLDGRWQALALGIGIGFGGMNGYGQLLSWIRGYFFTGVEYLPIATWIGFVWLAIIGIEWGGTAGIVLSWSLQKKIAPKVWGIRLVAGVLGALIGYYIVALNPAIFFPNYSEELYLSVECSRQCTRVAVTLPSLAMLLGIFIALLLVEIVFVKDRQTIKTTSVMSAGFCFAFPFATLWFFLDEYLGQWQWWKMWEMSIGLLGGLAIGIVFLMHVKSAEKNTESIPIVRKSDWNAHIVLNISFFVMLFYTICGLSISVPYLMGLVTEFDELEYPPARMAFMGIFIPLALILMAIHIIRTKRQPESRSWTTDAEWTIKFLYFNAYMTFVGLLGVAYSVIMLFYFGFFWIILYLVLKQHQKLINK